jgi:acetolactate synthase-1/2/3 large subunit
MEINGAKMFVKALQEEGVDTLFAYPGGTAIDLFDALYDAEGIDMILPRHEQALVHAADGYARSTGRVGVCLVTSGPGATNLVTGIATANYDSVPLVCFTGQVPMNLIGNDAFQEVDIVGITRSICKYAVTVRKREDLARIIKNAFYIARTGKPGPVVVDIPKDIQLAMGSDEYPTEVTSLQRVYMLDRSSEPLRSLRMQRSLCSSAVAESISHMREKKCRSLQRRPVYL